MILAPMRARWKFLLQTIIMLFVVGGSGIIDALQDWPLLRRVWRFLAAHGL